MNHFYIDYMLRKQREEEARECAKKRLLHSANPVHIGVLRTMWRILKNKLHGPQQSIEKMVPRTIRYS